jgi:Ni/Fe-hydrogenase subunit HybB-like protein
MFVYLFLKALVFLHGQQWPQLAGGWGLWYLTEMVGFVLVPCILFTLAVRRRSESYARTAAILALVGIVLNRLNVSVIAYKWYEAVRYYPTWMEIVVTMAVIAAEIWVFRWVVNRMPVLNDPPGWAAENSSPAPTTGYGAAVKEA